MEMADFVVKDPPEFDPALRMLETTDPDHADVFNALFGQLVNNDAFLAALARETARALAAHLGDGAVHVTEQDKEEWDAKAGTALATPSVAGLMAAADKQKLDGVEGGAQVNQNAYGNVKVGNATVTANGKTAVLTLEAGENVTLTADNAAKKVTVAANRDGGDADTLDGYHAAHFAASSEVDGLKKSVSDGKKSVAAAVTAKGVTTAADATFAAIAANVAKISTGVDTSDATATAMSVLTGKTFYAGGKKTTGVMQDVRYSNPAVKGDASQEPFGNVLSCGDEFIGTDNNRYMPFYCKDDILAYVKLGSALAMPADRLAKGIGLTAEKIVRGNTILGVSGTGGGGKDVTISGEAFSASPVKVNLSDYGITDYKILLVLSTNTIKRSRVPNYPTKIGTTYYDFAMIIKVSPSYIVTLGNVNNLATFNASFPMHWTSSSMLGAFVTPNFYRTYEQGAQPPASVGVGKFTGYSFGPYEPGCDTCEYNTRIIAF